MSDFGRRMDKEVEEADKARKGNVDKEQFETLVMDGGRT